MDSANKCCEGWNKLSSLEFSGNGVNVGVRKARFDGSRMGDGGIRSPVGKDKITIGAVIATVLVIKWIIFENPVQTHSQCAIAQVIQSCSHQWNHAT